MFTLLILVQALLPTLSVDSSHTSTDSLTLQQAYLEAEESAPIRSELEIQSLTARLKQQNYSTTYYPELAFTSQAVYYSEVARIPFSIPGQTAPTVSNDQYKVGLGLEQILYDGGSVARRKALEDATREYQNQTVIVSLYEVRQYVEQSFFGVLLARAHLESIVVRLNDLQTKLEEIHALIDEGVLTTTSADQIEVEVLRLHQQQSSGIQEVATALEILGEWMGRELPDDIILLVPDVNISSETTENRPEFKQILLARDILYKQDALSSLAKKPRLITFGEIAYGRAPGLNLFENDFKPYFSAGIRLRWAAWDWNRSSRDRQIIQLKQRSLDTKKQQLERQLKIELAQKLKEIRQIQSALETDNDIIELRRRIRMDAESRFDNGVANATDYVREVNAEQIAALALEVHRLELSRALIQYQTIQGQNE